MPANYPGSVYSPRTKANKAGTVYEPTETTKIYAEDVSKLDAEVVAIETELGTNPKGIYATVAANLAALWEALASFAASFLDLSDTPDAYTGAGGKVVAVNVGETGLEFITAAGGEKCTGAEINTGSNDTKFATPKAIADSDIAFMSDIPAPASVGGLYGINIQSLAANKTLTANTDLIYQYLNTNGSDRDVVLATAAANAGDRFIVRHNGAYNTANFLYVKQGATLIDIISAGTFRSYLFDGTNWVAADNGSGENQTISYNLAIGRRSRANNLGTAFGYNTVGTTNAVAVGYQASGSSHGVAVGYEANAEGNGLALGEGTLAAGKNIALGFEADSGYLNYAVAIGYYSKCIRVAETSISIAGDQYQYNNVVQFRLFKQTSDATPIEMLCGGVAAKRIDIRASSVLAFTGLVVARDNVAGHGAAYKIEGVIKRDASNNTAMIGAATVTVIQEDDASWDVTVAADDTNEALVITVKGDATNITKWAARIDGVETHF